MIDDNEKCPHCGSDDLTSRLVGDEVVTVCNLCEKQVG